MYLLSNKPAIKWFVINVIFVLSALLVYDGFFAQKTVVLELSETDKSMLAKMQSEIDTAYSRYFDTKTMERKEELDKKIVKFNKMKEIAAKGLAQNALMLITSGAADIVLGGDVILAAKQESKTTAYRINKE